MRNVDIRKAVSANGLKLWQLADKIGMSDSSLSRKLRKELPDAEKAVMLKAIEELKKEVEM